MEQMFYGSNVFLKEYLINLFFWLHRVLVAARRIFHCSVGSSLWHMGFSLVVAHRLLSSCGMWVFSV